MRMSETDEVSIQYYTKLLSDIYLHLKCRNDMAEKAEF